MKQKEAFLQSEGDAWFQRNRAALSGKLFADSDGLVAALGDILPPRPANGGRGKMSLLEIGCGDGSRLAWLRQHYNVEVAGIEPSREAVAAAHQQGVDARRGTADCLPFDDQAFDVVLFGFCLYLCDRSDLFPIAREADRVLKNPGWLLIHDFYSPTPIAVDYHHFQGLKSYKMDYRSLFTWHPAYTCASHKVRHHSECTYTDDPKEWVATSVLRKYWLGA